jgi:hypothetical protein
MNAAGALSNPLRDEFATGSSPAEADDRPVWHIGD